MERTAHDVLVEVRALLATRMRWAKGAAAYDLRNCEVSPTSPRAVRWSLGGALARVAGDSLAHATARGLVANRIQRKESGINIHRFNEVASHAELLAILDSAIESSALTVALR